jgi:hypothetical protein
MGAPDSPVRHRTGPVHCPVRRHVTQPLGFGSSRPLAPLSSCGTEQSGATPDRSYSLSGVPPTLRALFLCQRLLQSTVARVSHCSNGTPDSLVAHRTVWWHTGQSGELWRSAPGESRELLVQPCTGLVHQTLSGGTTDNLVRQTRAHLVSFCSFKLDP